MSELYVKARFLWVVVIVLVIVVGVSIFSYINTIEYQSEANNLKIFLRSERENYNNTKENFKNTLSILNQTSLNLSQKTTELTHAYDKISKLSIENTNVTFSLKDAKQSLNTTKLELSNFRNDFNNLTVEANILRNEVCLLQNKTLYNPTLSEVVKFLADDKTNEHIYDGNTSNYNTTYYVCKHFARDTLHNATLKGMNCYYVSMDLFDGIDISGHAIICFNTSDLGICFVEPLNDLTYFSLKIFDLYSGLLWPCLICDLTIMW